MNGNCLAGLACPQCQSDGPFDIVAVTTATMYDDGCDATTGMEWDDTSACVCVSCRYGAQVGAFRQPDAP